MGRKPTWGSRMEFLLEPTPPAAGSARRALHDAAIFDAVAEPDALLLVTELVTNSILQSRDGDGDGDAIRVRARSNGAAARVEVFDRGSDGAYPALKHDRTPHATSGRGLQLVDALSDRWGMDAGERGTCVWFELTL